MGNSTRTALSDTPAPGARAAAVSVSGVGKRFGDTVAVDCVDLDIAPGEFFSLLGPSGSGKTTLLRMIAGFELPSSGTIELNGVDVTTLPPFERDVNTVFQDYALFPHMTVLENVAYGLRVKGVGKNDRRRLASGALASVRLDKFGERKPSQLSGGQRQRVALARALVNRPSVLLLDEPLGALDLKLREEMQFELKALQREVGITFVFVTHDQSEALTLSDRIAVFNQGRIEQVGSAGEIYERPNSEFVAGFVGTSNLISGAAAEAVLGRTGTFLIRPEKLTIVAGTCDGPHAEGVVTDVLYVGWENRIRVRLDAGPDLLVAQPNREGALSGTDRRGERVTVSWDDRQLVGLSAAVESSTATTTSSTTTTTTTTTTTPP
jgi:putative spermidine/putrescine transport system ATP-binding protein